MKAKTLFRYREMRWYWASWLGLWMPILPLWAADTNAPPATAAPPALTPEQMYEGGTNTYNNWVDLGVGGLMTSGNRAQAQKTLQSTGGAFGGIEDFHYQGDVSKGTTLAIDGRSIFDENDYKLSLDLEKEKTGYLKFSASQFRTWDNGDGGFFPPEAAYFPLSPNALALDRGEISVEGGLTLEDKPKVTFKYTHTSRNGAEGSTSWGPSNITPDITRSVVPTVNSIDEHSDSFALDVTHKISSTDFGVGLRYDTGKVDDALLITQNPGEPISQDVTSRQGSSYDAFSAHAFTETWIKTNLMFSSGYSFTKMDTDFSGNRIYGNDFDVGFVPSRNQSDFGYFGLNGASELHEYVLNMNLLYRPTEHFTIIPSIRVDKEDTDANAGGFETLALNSPQPFASQSQYTLTDVQERLDLRYNGVTNWVFYGRGELTQGDGSINALGGLQAINGFGLPPIQQQTDDGRFFQKYTLGARWYPARQVTVDVGGYYKRNAYDYNNRVDSTFNGPTSPNRYPAFLIMQDFDTYDGNLRLTLRPCQKVSLITRYEYQLSTIDTRPDPISGLSELQSSEMRSHIIAQDITYTPWSRLSLQTGFNYVLSSAHTPASDVTQAILDAQNNYWTLNFSSCFVVNDKTDLNLGYFYYRADDYSDNSAFGLPLGADDQEHAVTASVVRRISKNMRLTVRYGYFHYDNGLYGGNRDFAAHLVSSTLQYRF